MVVAQNPDAEAGYPDMQNDYARFYSAADDAV